MDPETRSISASINLPSRLKKFRGKSPHELRCGTRIETEGIMDLVEVDAVIDRLDFALERLGNRNVTPCTISVGGLVYDLC
mgnify:CR=1 FL=1